MATKPAAGSGEAPDAAATTDDGADPRAAFYREQREQYVGQLETEIASIESKIDGMKSTLAAKREELKTAKTDAKARS